MAAAELPTLPADTQAILGQLRKERWYPVTGNTLDLNPKLTAAKEESGESDDVKRHLAMWERFRGRVDKRPLLVERHPQFRAMADDIRWWEAAKASVRTEDESIRSWFWKVPAGGRIELVKVERERRAAERRFKLAMKRNRQAA